ncbi:hypothetical protein FQN49_002892 [Arthroderma sp. PD_2]|nr:hypothetical protein FQN49_002892 [Arthroderma sp. PD_2]
MEVAALGVAAAAVQFAALAGKGIKAGVSLCKDLSELPAHLRKLLDDVDKSIDSIAQQQEISRELGQSLAGRISDQEKVALQAAADVAKEAMVDLRETLQPLFPLDPNNMQHKDMPRWSRKRWKAVTKESDVERKLERIKRLNGEVDRQLQRITAKVQVQNIKHSEEVLEGVKRIGPRLDRLESVNADGHADTQGSISQLSLRFEGRFDQQSQASQLRHVSLESQMKSMESRITTGVDHTRGDIQQLKEAVNQAVVLFTNNNNSYNNNTTSQQTATMQRPPSLAPVAYRDSIRCSPSPIVATGYPPGGYLPSIPQCSCRGRKSETRASYFRTLVFGCETLQAHESSCPRHPSSKYSSKYKVAINLSRWRVQLELGVETHGNKFELTFPLALVACVERSESAIFQAFDGFERSYVGLDDYGILHLTVFDHRFGSRWSKSQVEAARMNLQQLLKSLREVLDSGSGSISDTDENGSTVLHEVMITLRCVLPAYRQLSAEVDALIHLALDRGADPHLAGVRALRGPFTNRFESVFMQQESGPTAADMALLCAVEVPDMAKHFWFLPHFTESDLSPRFSPDGPQVSFSWRYADIINFFAGSLAEIILGRNLYHLKEALKTANMEVDAFSVLPVSALDLAIGWPEGLRVLSGHWPHSIARTIRLATLERAWESVEALCDFPVPLFRTNNEASAFFVALVGSKIRPTLIDVLKRRRHQLADLARHWLSEEEKVRFGLLEGKVLDGQARQVYKLLVKRSVPVPPDLHPGPGGSVYYSIARLTDKDYTIPLYNFIESLYELFLAGFRDLDAGNQWFSPLEESFRYVGWKTPARSKALGMGTWLLRVGASPNFHNWEYGGCRDENLLLSLAEKFSWYYYDTSPSVLMWRGKLFEYAASLYSPLQRDHCSCACSSNGCLPLHRIFGEYSFGGSCFYHKPLIISSWLEVCNIQGDKWELHLHELVRMELFKALGMVHTCCNWSSYPDKGKNKEKRSHLELLMAAYRNSRGSCPPPPDTISLGIDSHDEYCTECKQNGYHDDDDNIRKARICRFSDHWKWWWSKVAQIMPGLLCCDITDDDRELALKQRGYEGLDFTEVIKRHFADYLDPDEPSSEENPFESDSGGTGDNENAFIPRKRPELLKEALEHFEVELNYSKHLD